MTFISFVVPNNKYIPISLNSQRHRTSLIKNEDFLTGIEIGIPLNIFSNIFTNLHISLVMLPQAFGYDCRKALNGENHHENHLKVTNW